jgi:2-hydroxy-6-oxonona-2,4-dienedioate hydrolase/2-succinyl-6-hydroxy-2,4-cyclohexadiene-1-carboxylate synthase
MPNVTGNGVRIHYTQTGSGPDLVFLHGLGGTGQAWLPVIACSLSDKHRVTAYDLRGHGKSEMPASQYTSADMARDLAGVLDALEIESADVVGHSYGGRVALHFGVMFPERLRNLVVVDTRLSALQPMPRLREWPQWRFWRRDIERLGIDLDEDRELSLDLLFAVARRSGVFQAMRDDGRIERWDTLMRGTTAREDFEAVAGLTRDAIATVKQRTLAVYGELSFCLPTLHELQKLIHMTTVVVPGIGHFIPQLKPRLVGKHLLEFLAN